MLNCETTRDNSGPKILTMQFPESVFLLQSFWTLCCENHRNCHVYHKLSAPVDDHIYTTQLMY